MWSSVSLSSCALLLMLQMQLVDCHVGMGHGCVLLTMAADVVLLLLLMQLVWDKQMEVMLWCCYYAVMLW